jgi:NADH-quinone oxidoreductase subunit D
VEKVRELLQVLPAKFKGIDDLLTGNPIWQSRTQGIAHLDVQGCLALGVTGPVLRSAGLAWDLRKTDPYCGYEQYEFDVATDTDADCWGRFLVRKQELHESLKIIEQALDKLEPGRSWSRTPRSPGRRSSRSGSDGMGQSLDHVKKIMGTSMEALIHHFKLVTEGFRVPPGQVYTAWSRPAASSASTPSATAARGPYRVHVRDPSFTNLQATAAMCEGGMLSDAIAAVASIDPVMGGVDR